MALLEPESIVIYEDIASRRYDMKKTYQSPTLKKIDALVAIAATTSASDL